MKKRGQGMVYQRGRVYWIKFYDRGRPRYESSGSTRVADARRLLALRLGQVVQGSCPAPEAQRTTFEDLARLVEGEYQVNERRSLRSLRGRLKNLTRYFGGYRAANITTPMIQEYTLMRQRQGASNGTVNRELSVLRRAFTLAARATPPLVSRVPHIPMLAEAPPRGGFFEWDEFQRVRAAMPEELQPLVTFLYYTGWRRSEATGLTWDAVDMHSGTIRLGGGATKNRQPRVIFLTGQLLDLIQQQRQVRDRQYPECPWVFHRQGQPVKAFRRSWNTACRVAGVGKRLVHDFRRSCVRNLVRAGIPERTAMEIAGHKTRSVFERYNIVSEGDRLAAANQLDQYLKQWGSVTTPVTVGAISPTLPTHSSPHARESGK